MAESVRSEALAAVLADLRDASRAAATRVMRGEVPPEELSKVVRALAESVKVVAEVDLAERVLLPPSIPESESEASEPAEPTAKPTEDDWH
jgi:hypothetical protein